MGGLLRGLRNVVLIGTFAGMGLAKLFGAPWEIRWYRRWGKTADTRKGLGAAEAAGALLMLSPTTRRMGAALAAGASAPTLAAELDHDEGVLATARFALLVMSLDAVFGRP